MKALIASFTVATGVLAVVGLKQNQQIRSLTEANTALSQQLAAASAPAASVAASADASGKLSEGLLTELLQLRGEVARLRRQPPTARVAQAAVALPPPPVADEALNDEQRFRVQVITRVNALKNLGLAARLYANDHQDQFPSTLEALLPELGLDANGHFSGGVALDEFEFYPQSRLPTEREPQLILFRAKRPMVGPNGQEIHVFCLADGSVQQVTADRLAEFERVGTATGPAPQ